jgi:uncharacterized protein (DUF302 family)
MDGKRKGLSGSDVVVMRGGESIRSIRLIRPAAAGMQYESQIETQRRGTERYIQMKPDKAEEVSAQTTRTKFDGVLLTIRSRKSFFEVTQTIEMALPRFHIPKLMEYVTHGDRAGVEAYVDSTSKPFSIFWDFEQGSTMRLAGIPIESKFYLVGNAVIARGLFEYSGAAGLGAPVRICVSQRDGEQTRIDMDNQLSFFSKFTEMKPSSVPALLDEKLTKFFEEIAA